MGYRSFIGITNVVDNIGNPPDINFVDIDITLPSASIDHYIDVVESMSRKVIAGASVLGALSKRIEMQTEFADTLMASIDRGVGRLVDADMNEASVRLKAIQTRQQLAIHSLSIANSNAENLMQLFR
ncbi:flagellin [Agrobacterium pusense]